MISAFFLASILSVKFYLANPFRFTNVELWLYGGEKLVTFSSLRNIILLLFLPIHSICTDRNVILLVFMLQSVFRKSSSKNVLPGDKAVIPKTHHFHEGNIYLDVFAELLIPTKLD